MAIEMLQPAEILLYHFYTMQYFLTRVSWCYSGLFMVAKKCLNMSEVRISPILQHLQLLLIQTMLIIYYCCEYFVFNSNVTYGM